MKIKLGGVGRLFTAPSKEGYLKVGLLLVMCALLVAAVKGNEPRMNYPAASCGVSEEMLRVAQHDRSACAARRQTNVILRLKAEESFFKDAASCGELTRRD
jgi:hypothetical protein